MVHDRYPQLAPLGQLWSPFDMVITLLRWRHESLSIRLSIFSLILGVTV
jgi:hypothetical protein